MAIKCKKFISLFLICITLVSLVGIPVVYASNSITLTVSTVSAKPGETVEIPIVLTGNRTISGLTFSVTYSSDLTLEKAERGADLPGDFGFTPTKDLTSNPFKLVLDHIDGICFSGTVAVLTFKVSENVSGNLKVGIVYDSNDIFDENIENIETSTIEGGVNVISAVTEPTLSYSNFEKGTSSITLDVNVASPDDIAGNVFVALYNDKNYMVKMKMYPAAETVKASIDSVDGKYIKIMWWDDDYRPITESKKIDIEL